MEPRDLRRSLSSSGCQAATLSMQTRGRAVRSRILFGVLNETPFCDFSQAFCVVVSAATGTERVLAPGAEIISEVVRIAVNEQHPSLMATLYPGVVATDPRPFGTLGAIWLAFQSLAHSNIPTINGEYIYFEVYTYLPASSLGVRSSAPSTFRPAGNGRGQGWTTSQSPAWQTWARNSPLDINVDKSIPDCTDPWLDTSSNCWPLDEHHHAEVLYPDQRPSFVEWPTYAALRENRGHRLPRRRALTQTLYTLFHQRERLFVNPDLGQLGDDGDAYRR